MSELQTRSVAPLFDRVARVYDTELLQALIYRPTQDEVMAELRLLAPDRILDMGCGTGQMTARMADELPASVVYGCDLSEGMLAEARERSDAPVWVHGAAESVPLPDGAVDAITCTESFHFYDQPAALAEFHRLLAPGGYLLIALINPRTQAMSRLMELNGRLLGAGHWPDQRSMRALVEEAGFRVVRQHRSPRLAGRVLPTIITVAQRVD